MARDDSPPIPRGTYEPTAGALDGVLGKEYLFEDVDLNAGSGLGAKPVRTGKMVKCRLVQNKSAGNLLPKRLASLKVTGTAVEALSAVDGYSTVTAGRGFPIDEYLPPGGVPVNGYFYIVVEGPSLVQLPLNTGDFNGDISVGNRLVALTAATSGATTAGRVAHENITGSTQAADYTFLFDQISNRIGRALSAAAATNANTGTDLLIDVTKN